MTGTCLPPCPGSVPGGPAGQVPETSVACPRTSSSVAATAIGVLPFAVPLAGSVPVKPSGSDQSPW
jgi:hypothetical protein